MSISVKDLRAWLTTLDDDDEIAVDDGGVTLTSIDDPDAYLEVGGLPIVEDDDTEDETR